MPGRRIFALWLVPGGRVRLMVFPAGVVTSSLSPRRAWDRRMSRLIDILLPSMLMPGTGVGADLMYRLPAGPPLGLGSPFPASLIFLPWVRPLGILTSMALACPL